MENLGQALNTSLKHKLSIKFLEQSENFLSNSELSNLIEEIIYYYRVFGNPNLDKISNHIMEKSDKIRKEIEDLFSVITTINEIRYKSKELRKSAKELRILSISASILILGNYEIIKFGDYSLSILLPLGLGISILMALIFHMFYVWFSTCRSTKNILKT
ncbi:hypothetical protein D1867_10645 [Acidianus infernus]|uniref:Uncharacterized protein n=1 Tax=Acidianus infernus TaxID=12915 RepID=A0A6A9QK53_ACIIN|nr:hypothetical protein [Acidianus infernus]MUM65690.1 hypothetical protein [Acidianus infernus]